MSDRTHPESGTTAESLKGNGEIILVVDDEATVLRVTVMVLKRPASLVALTGPSLKNSA